MAAWSLVIRIISFTIAVLVTCAMIVIVKLLLLFAPTSLVLFIAKAAHKKFNFAEDDPVGPMESFESFATLGALRLRVFMAWSSFRNTAVSVGDPVPDLSLVLLGKGDATLTSRIRLRDYMKSGRPLVLNFGSCTLPPFTSELEAFNNLVKEHHQNVEFLIIYIKEIHATDEWIFPSNRFSVNQPQCVEERIMAAKRVAGVAKDCPVAVDDMDNKAMALFEAMPARLYILQDGKVVFKGNRGPIGYDLNAVIKFLNGSGH